MAALLLGCRLLTPTSTTPQQASQPALTQTVSPALVQSTQPTQHTQPTAIPPALPSGWKLSKDPTGICQAATPSEWQIGRDFFLQAETAGSGPQESSPRHFPPMGRALWADEGAQLPAGKWFQVRTSLVTGERVCSVWRIKELEDFTDVEKTEMEQVGKTLQEVP